MKMYVCLIIKAKEILILSFIISALYHKYFNGSQLAKLKKSIPDMPLPWNL